MLVLETRRENLLREAEQITGLILKRLQEIRRKPIKDLGLGSLLSFVKLRDELGNERNERNEIMAAIDAIEPKIYEIILFGSVAAAEKEDPDDIDLMIIDNGHFSNFFPCMTGERHAEDAYKNLGENLFWLLEGWFNLQEQQVREILGGVEVDLHVLSLNLLKSWEFREEVAEGHKDPDFFRNVFRGAMRFNRFDGRFEPLTLEYLEDRYYCQLDDLRSD